MQATPVRRLVAVLLTSLAAGCAPALSGFQPAHVGPKGTWSAEAGVDFSLATAAFGSSVDAAKAAAGAARDRGLSEEQKLEIFRAGLELALNPPAFVQHLGLAYNPLDRWEVSLRYASESLRLGSRAQLLTQEAFGADVSVGLGVARFSYDFPIGDIIQVIRLEDFSRWTFDVPLLVGWRGPAHRIWVGPKLAYTTHDAALVIEAPGVPGGATERDVARATGSGMYVGAVAGVAVGFQYVFVAVELTAARLLADAELNVFGRTASADTSTWFVSPGLAIMGEF